MQFGPDNPVVKLCAQGMDLEGAGKKEEALEVFQQAWEAAATDVEKLTAAHYVARHQKGVSEKLRWDETALKHALNISDDTVKGMLPSLYLNIGKCYEDMENYARANKQYRLALSFSNFLPDDEYGKMIKAGVNAGLERTA